MTHSSNSSNPFSIQQLTRIAIAAALICASSIIVIPLLGVPITLQLFFVFLTGMLLNSRNGFIAVLLWIILGLFGLPVFAGGRGGPGIIFTPTFGYIIGFLAAVTLTGKCNGHLKNDLLLLFLATIAVYLPGLVWIKFFLGVSLTRTLEIGFYPFIILDLLKIAFAWTVWQRIKEQLKTS